MKKSVVIVEMGLRDGLQNEVKVLDADTRVEFAQRLIEAGVKRVEIGAFVSPQWVPQMAGTADVIQKTFALVKMGKISKKIEFSALVPNERGMQDALKAGVKEIAIFAACSESFSLKNINCSIDESFKRFEPVMALAKKYKIKVRGYLSTCFGCPFEGRVPEAKVVKLAQRMHKLGVYEISIGDTIGVANAGQVESLFRKLKKVVPVKKLAGHFHDTRGQALANILEAYKLGVTVFDTSLGGLGGCPYAPGATGNVATEDVVYMFHGMGIKTGLNLDKLISINPWMSEKIEHKLPSKVGKVGMLRPLGKVTKSKS
ncbi:hydroxymethylglutaryl-CoA lyase [Bdellovibrio bacteriovorus]|uniref:Hydroxymethylglutaryl-CoA lyase n=1 Tax=Bdellovibrio bacteriovorus TaxID=959 RepID=A0A150WPE2_BDEBC|nr:hydroxymethylglutaryl-CoA lyase [Bdellovibrio bacteriovorus]KYG66373.1 hydroxymethylglutaryl-CoA lyase [Bdellovibrio bacteriovorus]